MKTVDHKDQCTDKVAYCDWFDRRSVTMLFSNLSGMQSTSTVQTQMKGSATKVTVPFPDFLKMYIKGMSGINYVNHRKVAYHLDRKSSIRFYLRIFFDLLDVACVDVFIVYNMTHQNDLTLLDYKTIVPTNFNDWYTSRSRTPPEQKAGSNRKHQYQPKNLPLHLTEFQHSRKLCEYCFKEGFDRKTFSGINQGQSLFFNKVAG